MKMITLTVVASLKEFLSGANIIYRVKYGIEESPFGPVLVACVDRFLCLLKFQNPVPPDGGADLISRYFPEAVGQEVSSEKNLFDASKLDVLSEDIYLLVEGTQLQEAVWRALLQIPAGATCFYSDVAQRIGRASAVRAVATAVGKNPIAYFIPCHRVVGKNSNILKFAAGPEIKRRLLEREGILISSLKAVGRRRKN